MVDELVAIVKRLNKTDEKIDEISKQWVVLKHEYRNTKDKNLKLEIKKKWINYKRRWKHLKKKTSKNN